MCVCVVLLQSFIYRGDNSGSERSDMANTDFPKVRQLELHDKPAWPRSRGTFTLLKMGEAAPLV